MFPGPVVLLVISQHDGVEVYVLNPSVLPWSFFPSSSTVFLASAMRPPLTMSPADEEKYSRADALSDEPLRLTGTTERRLMAKIDLHLLPVLSVLYLLAFLDRYALETLDGE